MHPTLVLLHVSIIDCSCCGAAGAQVTLRQYQQEGISWLAFLHKFGLHGILADDMVREDHRHLS
jgi:SNF2 family DNA or RNA helicase